MERSDRRHLAGKEPDSSNGHKMGGGRSGHCECDCQRVALSVSPIVRKQRLEKLSREQRSVNCSLSRNPSSTLGL
ncbi:hypothetical protein Q8A67_019222 [Cirrhinus molitorella]|uniref:Uncharacterized protein n=1 Tax=Cirrhinus molitorella TaxID=172907 RepID=A0AA88PL77_9TELE|nr:hypothetical protein Q8A67_019222 [Cirrhinus molitorella]